MINVKDQQDLLLNLSKKLKNKLTVYAVGGTAMMFHALKDTTKDIDLVFSSEKDRLEFKKAAEEIDYEEKDAITVYGTDKENQPIMLVRGDAERFDLFNYHVISFFFSDNMQKRAEDVIEFGDKLILKIANVHDLIVMKCATDRQKDAEDAKTIVENEKIEWNILIEEAKHQVELGKDTAIMELGDFLEKLKNQLKVDVPQSVLDELLDNLKEQINNK